MTVSTQGLSVDDVTHSKPESGQTGMGLRASGRKQLSPAWEKAVLSTTRALPPQFNPSGTDRQTQERWHPATTTRSAGNSRATEVKWGLGQGTNSLQKLLCQNKGERSQEQGGDRQPFTATARCHANPQMSTEPHATEGINATPHWAGRAGKAL